MSVKTVTMVVHTCDRADCGCHWESLSANTPVGWVAARFDDAEEVEFCDYECACAHVRGLLVALGDSGGSLKVEFRCAS